LKLSTKDYDLQMQFAGPDILTIDAHYHPRSKPPIMHLHPYQSETITLLDGRLQAVIGGEASVCEAGQTVRIPAGTPHQMWNPFAEPARTRWETRPALRTAQFLQQVHSSRNKLALAACLYEYRDVFRPCLIREPLQSVLLQAVWTIVRLLEIAGVPVRKR
jgi:hypothetical protein